MCRTEVSTWQSKNALFSDFQALFQYADSAPGAFAIY